MTLLKLRRRVVRTLIAFFPALAAPDDAFARQHLSEAEYALYAAMDVRDRDHACQVALGLVALVPNVSDTVLRAALLHDVGKSAAVYNPWERILVHLYTPGEVPPHPRLDGLRGVWQRRVHHARYGADLIRQAGGDDCVAALVARHHRPGDDTEARLLKQVEEAY